MFENMLGAINSIEAGYNVEMSFAEKEKRFFEKVASFGVDLEEIKPILQERNNVLVISCAGAGKTLTLVLRVLYDIYMGYTYKTMEIPSVDENNHVKILDNILITTFLKTGAQELSRVFYDWADKLGIIIEDKSKIKFCTVHAEAYQCLTAILSKISNREYKIAICNPEDETKYVKEVMKRYSVHPVDKQFSSSVITIDEVNDIEGLLTFCRNRLDDSRYSHSIASSYNVDKVIIDSMLEDIKAKRSAQGVMDFDDIQELLLKFLQQNQVLKDFVNSRYSYIYCDEWQDTSQLQYELLKYYFRGNKVFCVGDDDQCIYGWRGSDVNIITKTYREDFNAALHKLSTNYRCGANIVNAVIPSISKNKNRYEKELKAKRDGGTIKTLVNYPVSDLISRVSKAVRTKSVAIISRTNADLLIPAMILEINGGIDYGLSKSVGVKGRMAKQVFQAIKLVTQKYNDYFVDFFRNIVPFRYVEEATSLVDTLKENSISLFDIDEQDMIASVPYLYNSFLQKFIKLKRENEIECYIYVLMTLRDSYGGKSAYARKARDLCDWLIQLIHSDLCEDMDIYEIDNLLNKLIPEALEKRVGKNGRVKLTTVHEAKGKEYDLVCVWNDTAGVFPATVGNRELTQEEFEEERRLHYIAITRGKNEVYVYTTRGLESPFLNECNIEQDVFTYNVGTKFELT